MKTFRVYFALERHDLGMSGLTLSYITTGKDAGKNIGMNDRMSSLSYRLWYSLKAFIAHHNVYRKQTYRSSSHNKKHGRDIFCEVISISFPFSPCKYFGEVHKRH
jgi:hypothetical protein